MRTILVAVACVSLGGCMDARHLRNEEPAPTRVESAAAPQVTLFVVKRAWHVDVGMAVRDLQPPLASLATPFPDARFLLFGFGDRHYLLHKSPASLLAALWPGPAVVLVTSLTSRPEVAFDERSVVRLSVGRAQMSHLQAYIWSSLASRAGEAVMLEQGPHAGSAYYESVQRYSAVHTCNTWAAAALRAAGLPVHSSGMVFASQVWQEVHRVQSDSAQLARHSPTSDVGR